MNDKEILDPSVQANTTAQRIEKALRTLLISTCLLYVGLIGITYYVYSTSQNNKDALCAFRFDLNARIDTAQQFLVDNPNGVPGISAALLKTQLANQKRAAKAFAVVKCN